MPNSGIRFLFFLAWFAFVLISLAATELFAQGTVNINDRNAVNLSNVRASAVSDQPLKIFVERANRQGVTIDQALELVVTRGLSASEAQEMRSRITGLQNEVAITAAEDSEGLRQHIIQDLQSERHVIEKSSRSNIFGSSLFRNRGFNLTPSLHISTPENYQLGIREQLIVTIWGDRTDRLILAVDPEGAINLQNCGPIYVNGLTIEVAKKRLIDQFIELYI
jgi:hypothetical protein